MTRFQQLLNDIELLKKNKQNCSKKWAPYRITPLQHEIEKATEFSKNFMNEDGTICHVSLAILLLELRDFESRIEDLEYEVKELRCGLIN